MKARSGRSEKAGRLEEAIESMAIEFANGILGAIRAAPMDELLRQMRNVGLKETRQANREASRPAGVPCLERHCCLAELSLQLSKRGWEVRS